MERLRAIVSLCDRSALDFCASTALRGVRDDRTRRAQLLCGLLEARRVSRRIRLRLLRAIDVRALPHNAAADRAESRGSRLRRSSRSLAIRLKYGRKVSIARTMAHFMVPLVSARDSAVLVPVPSIVHGCGAEASTSRRLSNANYREG
jgi:hypothetical protein